MKFSLAVFLFLATVARASEVSDWCAALDSSFEKLNWKTEDCSSVNWKIGGKSVEGRPLVYAEFGDPQAKNKTLVISSVHGDENTPIYVGIELVHWLKGHPASVNGKYIVVAPLANPDGFYHQPRTRMNARGVDVNRNFLTSDWNAHALRAWKIKYRSDPRRFPGSQARSEPETVFQEDLIHKVQPRKILSIHSPLNHLDYDGPTPLSLARFSKDYVSECLKLRSRVKAVSTGFFPGSLGNFAGRELGIPTLTLELPSADPKKARQYWLTFSRGIDTVIDFELP